MDGYITLWGVPEVGVALEVGLAPEVGLRRIWGCAGGRGDAGGGGGAGWIGFEGRGGYGVGGVVIGYTVVLDWSKGESGDGSEKEVWLVRRDKQSALDESADGKVEKAGDGRVLR